VIVVSKLPNGLDLGDGVVLRKAMLGHEPHQRADATGRERLMGYEITRGVPDWVWERWLKDNARGPIVRNWLVAGFPDEGTVPPELPLVLQEFCVRNRHVRGWTQAPQTSG
jgi:hypothetical protein